jgi:uncharacterized protein
METAPLEDDPLTPLNPAHRKVLRDRAGLFAAPLLIGAMVLESAQLLPAGLFAVPAVLAAGWFILAMPGRRYRARGYLMGADRLRVVSGVLLRRDTVVPFGRVQHLDVEQGPLERRRGLATLVLHTAGTHNASVSLPGLAQADALAMREAIRAHIGRETM